MTFEIAVTVVAVTPTPSPFPVSVAPTGTEWPMFDVALAALFINVALAFWTGMLFMATRNMAAETKKLASETARMAAETADLARDTVDASDRADEHHQQTLWPFIAIEEGSIANSSTPGTRFELFMKIRNIGTGIAVKGHAWIMLADERHGGAELGQAEGFGPLAPGDNGETTIPGVEQIYDAHGARPAEITVRMDFITIFGTSGATDWKYRPSTGAWWPIGFKAPEIARREAK